MSDLSLSELAEKARLALPDALARLFADGRTRYGRTREEWRTIWRVRLLTDPPALASTYDYEWLDETSIFETMDEWLSPQWQGGRRFLPFAQTGAGDIFCLTAIQDASPSVACIRHDSGTGETEAASFIDFVYRKLVEALTDYRHLSDAGFSVEEGSRCLIADIKALAPYLPLKQAEALLGYCNRSPQQSERTEGCKTAFVPSLASKEEASMARLLARDYLAVSFAITPRWEIG